MLKNAFKAAMLLLLTALPVVMVNNALMPTSQTSSSLIRLHIIAEDDSLESQSLKLALRDAILSRFAGSLSRGSFDEARAQIARIVRDIEEYANQTLARFGSSENCKVSFGREEFPDRTYADVLVPAGEYDALVVRIGKAEGRNWWCVMYPPLCLLPADTEKAAEAALLSMRVAEAVFGKPVHVSFIDKNAVDLPTPERLAEVSATELVHTEEEPTPTSVTFGDGLFHSVILDWFLSIWF